MDFDPLVLACSLAAAIIPTVVYVAILVILDRHEKEPWYLMALVFVWGAAPAIMVSLMGEIVLAAEAKEFMPGLGGKLFNVAVIAPIVEELAKAAALGIVFMFARKEFDGIMDGLLYGSLAGFGFAMTENVFYFNIAFNQDAGFGIHLAFMRAVVFGMNHALFASMFGLGLGVARYGRTFLARTVAPTVGLIGAIALHMCHNFFVSVEGIAPALALLIDWAGVGMWLFLVYAALQQEAQWIREELADEVAHGLLTLDEAEATANLQWRAALTIHSLRKRMERYAGEIVSLCSLAAELAFKKRQHRIHGDEEEAMADIEQLREQIRAVRERLK
jgi:RsiW-degrading membrane proteinase PrsW (M82 family)